MYIITQKSAGIYLNSTTWNLLKYIETGTDPQNAVVLNEGDAKMIANLLNDIDGDQWWSAESQE